MIKTLIFTGGGSGGHVMPALTLIQELKKMDCDIHYIGGYNSIEKDLNITPFIMENLEDIFPLKI